MGGHRRCLASPPRRRSSRACAHISVGFPAWHAGMGSLTRGVRSTRGRYLAKRTVMVRVVPGQEDAFWSVEAAVPRVDPEARSGQRVKPGTPGHVATAPAAGMVSDQGNRAGAEGGHGMRWRASSRFLRNAFLVILLLLVWDAIFTPYLPAAYQS